MTTPAPWTVPPGFRISDGAGGSKDPLTGGVQVTPPITISSAELLDLHNVPKVLVPAQGAGKVTMAQWVIYRFTGGAAAYTFDPANILRIGYAPSPSVFELTEFALTGVFDQASIDHIQNQATTVGGDVGSFVNQPIVAQFDSALSTGNGTLSFIVAYLVV